MGFKIERVEDWSQHVSRSYGWIRDRVLENRDGLLELVDEGTIDGTVNALGFWVEAAEAKKIGWAMFVAQIR